MPYKIIKIKECKVELSHKPIIEKWRRHRCITYLDQDNRIIMKNLNMKVRIEKCII